MGGWLGGRRFALLHFAERQSRNLLPTRGCSCLAHDLEDPTPSDVERPSPGARQTKGVWIVTRHGEEHNLRPPDQVLIGYVAHAVARRHPAIDGVIPIITHHEVMTRRHL